MHSLFLAQLPAWIPFQQKEGITLIELQSTNDVALVVKLANQTQIQLTLHNEQTTSITDSVALDFSKLNRIRRYRDNEFLMTVEAGISIEQLTAALDEKNQRLACLFSPTRKLCSVLAEETLSLTNSRFGPLRQWIMGLEAVTGDGEMIHYGGEVVKNVTGYDLNKLFIGSRHRYGLITSVTLKLEPKAELTRSFLFHLADLPQALSLSEQLLKNISSSEVLTLFKVKSTFGWQLLVTLSGYQSIVEAESEWVHQQMSKLNANLQELYLAPQALMRWVQKLDWCHPEEPEALVLRIALPQKQLLDLPYHILTQPDLKSADILMPMGTRQMLMRWVSVNLPSLDALEILRAQVTEQNGSVQVLRLPSNFKTDLSDWMIESHPVLRQWETRLKQQFDPNGILKNGLGIGLKLAPTDSVRR